MEPTTAFEIAMLTDLPVVAITLGETYKQREHQKAATRAVNEQMDQVSEKVFLLYDMTRVKVDWGEMIMGLADARDAYQEGAHANYLETLIVVKNPILKMGLKALGQQQYGGMRVTVFDTLDAAISYVQSKRT